MVTGDSVLHRMPWAKDSPFELSKLLKREWLCANGLGGYASGTVSGACTRRFHGLLIASLPPPLGRIMMLNQVREELRLPDRSLVSLALVTGRYDEAGYILRMFARHVRDGLIPNLFPEGGQEGLYHTADATLWFFHALDRYLQYTDDRATLLGLLPALQSIIDQHRQGTRFGIGMDPKDGLLRQGDPALPLTWMDAKVEDWIVTPRRGKAVEINALWYNALKLMDIWAGKELRNC